MSSICWGSDTSGALNYCAGRFRTRVGASLWRWGPACGPLDVGGAKIVNLPALKIGDADFHRLVDENGLAVDDAWKAARKDELCAAYAQAAPDILITEAFPFGRRQMRFELDPLLSLAHSAKHRPLIVCSVRDILKSERKPGRAEETVETIAKY